MPSVVANWPIRLSRGRGRPSAPSLGCMTRSQRRTSALLTVRRLARTAWAAESAERTHLLESAAEHREHAIADRRDADVVGREAAEDQRGLDQRLEDS